MQSMPETCPELKESYKKTLKTLEDEGFHIAQTIPTEVPFYWWTVSLKWWTVIRNRSKRVENKQILHSSKATEDIFE